MTAGVPAAAETNPAAIDSSPHLERRLGPWSLWGLGVGYVISGEYFGWNLGLPQGGAASLLIAFGLATTMYVAFVLSYVELACAIPRAGGGFTYALRGLGPFAGWMTGIAQAVEFVFAPPAIAMATGAYAALWLPGWDPRGMAILAMTMFTALNMWGVRQAALFELVVALFAMGELALFIGVTGPYVRVENLFPAGESATFAGVFASLPFAIWFYLAIEGVANAAEEARNPQRDVLLGFGWALATLVVLAGGVLICAIGVGGWERIVYVPGDLLTTSTGLTIREGATPSDSPLPLAIAQVYSASHPLYQLLVGVGGLGLICSLNGILFAAGRAVMAMGQSGMLPGILGRIHATRHTPVPALALNWLLGAMAILFLDTAGLITLSAMGGLVLYVLSMEALVRLRTREPDLPRPFRAPFYPLFPRLAQLLAGVILAAMLWQNLGREGPWWKSLSAMFGAINLLAVAVYAPRWLRAR